MVLFTKGNAIRRYRFHVLQNRLPRVIAGRAASVSRSPGGRDQTYGTRMTWLTVEVLPITVMLAWAE
jgi:hypothetical protein